MKALDKRQRNLLLGLLGALALLAILLLVPRLAAERETPEASLVGTIPEADLEEGEDTKTGSYRRGGTISDYWDSLEEGMDRQERESPPAGQDGAPGKDRRPPSVGVDDLFGDCRETPTAESARTPQRRSAPRASSGGGAAAGKGQPPQKAEPSRETPEEEPSGQDAPRQQVKRSGAVSSLDEDVSSDLGNGFSTLDGTDRWVGAESGKPYRCMFTRDEKVKSGQRITLRLLEDLVIGGVHIPRNTHLQGLVTVSDRMEIRVSSLDIGGRILSFHFEAYDTDGGKGIYCSDLSQTGKRVVEQGIATVSSTLGSGLGRVARDAASVGASIVRNKSGEATVTVPAGYTFYILEETR